MQKWFLRLDDFAKEFTMNTEVRKYLIEVARKRQTSTYSEVNDACRLGLVWEGNHASAEIGRILGEISEYEFQHNRPLISAIVFKKGTTEQGEGFYALCEHLGIGTQTQLRNNFFAELEVGRCHDYWSNDEQYAKYA